MHARAVTAQHPLRREPAERARRERPQERVDAEPLARCAEVAPRPERVADHQHALIDEGGDLVPTANPDDPTRVHRSGGTAGRDVQRHAEPVGVDHVEQPDLVALADGVRGALHALGLVGLPAEAALELVDEAHGRRLAWSHGGGTRTRPRAPEPARLLSAARAHRRRPRRRRALVLPHPGISPLPRVRALADDRPAAERCVRESRHARALSHLADAEPAAGRDRGVVDAPLPQQPVRARGAPGRRPDTRLRETWRRVGGWAVHGCEAGDGPPLVLVHGLGVSGRYLLPIARTLAGRFRVVVPDLPGFGLSTRPRRPLRLDELSETLDRLADAIGFRRATFLANSYGCQVVKRLAVTHPERVERLVLVGPTVDDSARDPVRQAARLLVDGYHEPRSLVAIVLSDYLRAGPVTVATGAAEALRHRIEDDARRVAAPALVVRGARDPLVPQPWVERLTAAFRAGELHVIAGAPHAAHFTHPDVVAALVTAGTPPRPG